MTQTNPANARFRTTGRHAAKAPRARPGRRPLRLVTGLAAIVLLGTMVAAAMPASAATTVPEPAVKFGMDSASVSPQTTLGIAPDYGTFWIGPWTLTSGWGGPDGQLQAMKDKGVTPAVHFYYWGDDISPTCVEKGCWSSLHNAQKTRAGWETLADQMTAHLNTKMGGKPVVVFLESEFNKGGIETYEPFDGYLAAMAQRIHDDYPAAIIVLGFGNWGSTAWGTFDRAAAESDMVGIQGMRGSTRQTKDQMLTLYDGVLSGVKSLNSKFPGRAVMLTDIAVSSYPEPDYLQVQADALGELLDNLGTLRGLGVEAVIYRSWYDSPNMDVANYYGQAERHWGLDWNSQSGHKAAGTAWVAAVKAERARAATVPNLGPSATFAATASGLTGAFDATASTDGDGDALSYAWDFGDGAKSAASGSATASHAYLASGTYVVTLTVSDGEASATATRSLAVAKPNAAPVAAFAATSAPLSVSVDASASRDPDGDALAYTWDFGDGATASGKSASHAYAKPGTYSVSLQVSDGKASASTAKAVTVTAPAFTATFTPKGNAYWVEVTVSGSNPVAKVEVKAGAGAWTVLPKTDWGTYAKSMNVPKGTTVQFRATDTFGQVATSPTSSWLGASAPAMTASFAPKQTTNNYWAEVTVSTGSTLSKVELRKNGGAWVIMDKSSWGAYTKSVSIPVGTKVEFRATASTGATATSGVYTWT